jgi:large subunit ribosomal protein L30
MTNEEKTANNERYAIIRVRGLTGVRHDIDKTLKYLMLTKKNSCVVVPQNSIYYGMIKKVKDYVTWGEIDEETFKILIEKRSVEYHGKLTDDKKKITKNKHMKLGEKIIRKTFNLNSPKKGYGRKGIKTPFSSGGALDYRGIKINDLIKRMI